MNTYKKTIITLGMVFIAVPHICSALDTDGIAITGALKTVYTNNFMPNKILTNTDLTKWNALINSPLSNYITKNSTVAGMKDTLLIKSLTALSLVNTKMINAINKSRVDINERNPLRAVTGLQQDASALEEVRSAIVAIETLLKKESYYIPSKKNAKEVLLFALEFMRGATETAIAQVKRNMPSGY